MHSTVAMEEFPEDYHYALMGIGTFFHFVGEVLDAIFLYQHVKNQKGIGKLNL